jgi:hypothetical protein
MHKDRKYRGALLSVAEDVYRKRNGGGRRWRSGRALLWSLVKNLVSTEME